MSTNWVPPDHNLNLDDDIDRVKLDSMVKYWIKCSEQIRLKDVDYRIIKLVSEFFPPKCDWKVTLAASLGIHNQHVLELIEGNANACRKWPSEVLLKYCIDSTSLTFGDLLLELYGTLRRLDCLQALYDSGYVLELLVHLNADDLIIQKLKLVCPEAFSKVFDARKLKTDNPGYINQQNSQIIGPSPNNTLITNAPQKKKLVILLTYSKDAEKIVPELVKKFWAAGCGVICEHVLRGKGYFELDFVKAWEQFFKKSRFVVPVISHRYLEDIRQPSDDIQSQGVRFVYDLYTRKYIRDGCRNHIVRPLLMNDVPVSLLNRVGLNPTLEIRWQLPAELTSFLDMMTKYSVRLSNDHL